MFELTILQELSVADAIVTDEVAQLSRRFRHRGARKVNSCLITLTNEIGRAHV